MSTKADYYDDYIRQLKEVEVVRLKLYLLMTVIGKEKMDEIKSEYPFFTYV